MTGFLGLTLLVAASSDTAAQLPLVAARASASHSGMMTVKGQIAGDDIIRTARRHLGVRYVLGGSTPSSFDCSGFVQYVFAQHGIAMPRTARQQAGVGEAPYPGDLQPGDLLFFYGGQGAQHIAIYVGGDTIIHASSTGRQVRLDLLSGRRGHESWFRQRLVAVRRVLPAEGYFFLPLSGGTGAGPGPVDRVVESLAAMPVVFE